jgi:hypothetical protein
MGHFLRMRYTGTFLGGPYDGEIRDYDTKLIVREDPDEENNQFGIFTAPELIFIAPPERTYEWIMDDDGRGWWVPTGMFRR